MTDGLPPLLPSRYLAILDVGHGACAVVRDGSAVTLVDAGPSAAILEFCRRHGVKSIDRVILTHADADHIKGLVLLLSSGEIKVGEVLLNSDAQKGSKDWSALVWELDHLERDGHVQMIVGVREGESFPVGTSIHLRVLAPRRGLVAIGPGGRDNEGRLLHANTLSAVLRVDVESRLGTALLTGDLDEVGLQHLIDTRAADLKADVLVFPHHGGNAKPSATPALNSEYTNTLLDHVHPRSVIFSIGRGRHNTPRPEILAAIRSHGSAPRVACTQMSVHCAVNVTIQGNHLLPVFSVGRERKICCAGTVILDLDKGGDPSPLGTPYDAFRREAAPTALCRLPIPMPPADDGASGVN
ncbi:ComEC/Rec2 family competence protein [Microbispora sp. H10830]|uniref:ComEC/Rec2 family competence protein n=1 Tax=Microbispora sp. H10830 TaxID=2729109 RepID=UPI0037CCBCA4